VPIPPVPPPPPAYEPVFQNIPEPRRVPPPAPPYEPLFQTSPEPTAAPPPPAHEPPPEPQWPPPPPTPPTHEPVFQSSAGTEPKRMPAPAPRPQQTDENNLAEMAQRLEAALRRPTKPVEPLAPPPPAALRPAARPEPAAAPMSRAAAYFESLNAPKGTVMAPEPPPSPELKVLPGQGTTEPQAPLESLEDEMAKMLGRAPGKT
jgi:flagellar protein FliO/FliZ